MPSLSEVDSNLANHLKQLLCKFAVPDSSTLMQVSKELNQLSEHPSFLSSLFFILSNDEDVQIRHTAAVVFRRKMTKLYKSIDDSHRIFLKEATLQRLQEESEQLVRHSVMEIIGSIYRNECVDGRTWPEAMNFIGKCLQSSNLIEKQCGSELLKIVCASSAEHLTAHYNDVLVLIGEALHSKGTPDSAYYCVQAFDYLIPFLGDEQTKFVRPLVLKSVEVIRFLLDENMESRASELVELFESLIETEVAFIAPFVKDLVVFTLQVAANKDLEDETRSRVLSLLQSIIKSKKKAILKHNLTGTILDVICPFLIAPFDESNEDDESGFIGENDETPTPLASSLHVIDDMALHLPPEKLFTKIMPFVQSCASSNEDCHKRGLLLTLGCLSEGTSEFIKSNHLRSFLEIICKGATDANPRVRSSAMFALGQFSEHLQPDVSEYASEIMPMLFQVLNQVAGGKKGSVLTKSYYALENFVENLESNILPYLEQIMRHLLDSLKISDDIHTKELVVSAIGAVANAAKENLLPYLDEILSLIQTCLSTISQRENEADDLLNVLHTQSLDTLSVLVRTLGKSKISLAEDAMKLGLSLVDMEKSDPDIRRAAFGLFSAVSSVVGESIEPFVDVIVKHMINTIQSNEGIVAHFNESESESSFAFLDDSDETDLQSSQNDDDDCNIVDGFSVENAYMDEKSDAIDALGDISKYSRKCFHSHIDRCFEEVFKLHDFPHPDIRKAALSACGQFVVAAYHLQHKTFSQLLAQIFPAILKAICEDTERLVVMTILMTLKEIIEACGVDAFANKEQDLQTIMAAVVRVLRKKTACQDDEDEDEEEQQAEYDEMLIEYCGEIFPVMAEKLHATFLPYFMACLPTFLGKLKPSCSSSERSFSAGTIAETVEKLGTCCPSELLKEVVPKFIQATRDQEPEVRNNAIFGLGVILQNGGAASINHYPLALGCLSQALSRGEPSRRVVDNILGAVSRMILANKNLVPLKEVVPVLLSHLPLVEDHDEDSTVYRCLAMLLRDEEIASDIAILGKIIEVFANVVRNKDVEEGVKLSIQGEVREFRCRDAAAFEKTLQLPNLNEDLRNSIRGIL